MRLVYNDSFSSFSELLQKDNSFTIHHQNIQELATEIYKLKHLEAPKIISELFSRVNPPYNLRKDTYNVKAVHYGTEALSYLGPKKSGIWLLPKLKTLKH